jgi:CheY-like chemotaxis protein
MAKILVIDDEEQLRDLIKKMLTRDGHQILMAQDGEEGVRAFHQFNPDLIITDIIMPNKDGIEVIMELLKSYPEFPIIAISGGRRAITAGFNLDSAEMLGVKGILQKPFTHQQLKDIIQKILPV